MPRHGRMRHGSLQFYPRVRAKKIIPRVRWNSIPGEKSGLLGFIGYKVGMKSAYVKDDTPNSFTKGKRITLPVTIIECPTMKILSIRFYKHKKIIGEVLNPNLDKELKRKIKIPKVVKKKLESFKDYDDVRVLVYSQVRKTSVKKKPDIAEVGLSGTKEEKLEFAKEHLNKEISVKNVFNEGLVDVRGITKGKGNQGPRKRFGLRLRAHKSEKGVRGPGSGGPWHPSRVEFTQPMAGQMGFFTRICCNSKIIFAGNISEDDINFKEGFKKYGNVKNDYVILHGSVQGPSKRQLLLTSPHRKSKQQKKKKFEFIELR